MELSLERRALNAARAVATAHGLGCEQSAVVYSGSNVLVHLRPAPVVARVMTGTVVLHDDPQRWLEREISVLEFLAPSGLAVAPSPLVAPGPHRYDGLWLTFAEWVPDVKQAPPLGDAASLGAALRTLHDALASFAGELGTLSDLRGDIVRLHHQLRPSERVAADRIAWLRARLDEAGDVFDSTLPVQPLHGDASFSNLLQTRDGLVWNDFEDTFRGPVHWDIAGYTMSLRTRGASPAFIRQALDQYGWGGEDELTPFVAAHEVYDEIWQLYERQRRPAGPRHRAPRAAGPTAVSPPRTPRSDRPS